MHFFVTGGSGFLGINCIRYLLERGHTVTSYDIVPFDYPEKNHVRAIIGDIRDKAALMKSMRGADVVIHTAAALPLYSEADIKSTDIDGARNVFESVLETGVSRVIHISSTAVYGVPDHHPIYETDRLHGVGAYGMAKIEAEKIAEGFRNKGLTVSILRPKSFVGPERLGVFALFYEWASEGRNFPMIGSGDNRYQLLDVEDLCTAIYLCATKEKKLVNDTFNIGAVQFETMKKDFQAVLDHAEFGKRIISLPAGPIILLLRILETLRLSPLYKWVYETASKDSFVSVEKATRQLGFHPVYANRDALVRNFDWYLAHKELFQKTSGVSHRVPWKQGILGIAKLFF